MAFIYKKCVQAVFYFFTAAEKHILLLYWVDWVSFIDAFARWKNNYIGLALFHYIMSPNQIH